MTGSADAAARAVSILFLEDQPNDVELALYEIARSSLDAAAKRVETEAAFRAALAEPPDLILADYNLPQYDGISALKVARELAPDTPFILISADIGEELAVQAMRLGAADYLMKDRLARLGPAVEAALAGARLRKQARRAEQLLEAVAQGTAQSLGEDFMRSLVHTVATALDVKLAFVGELIGKRIRTLALWVDGSRAENIEYRLAGTPCTDIVAGEVCYYPSGVRALFPEDAMLVEFGIESYLGFPLAASDESALGVLVVLDDKPMEIAPAERATLGSFANRAAAELERLRAQQSLARSTRALRVLGDSGIAQARSTTEQELLDAVCRIACEAGSYRLAWVGYAEHDAAKTIRPVAHAGGAAYLAALPALSWSDDDERGGWPAGRAIRSGEPVVERDIANSTGIGAWQRMALEHGFASVCALPLRAADETIGALAIYAAERNSFDEEEVALLGRLAGDLAYGIVALRHAAERAAAEFEHHRMLVEQQAILEHAGVGIVFLKDSRIARCNSKFERMFGYGEAELIGRTTDDLNVSVGGTGARVSDTYGQIDAGGTFALEAQAERKDGSLFWIRMTLNAVDAGDLAQGVIWVAEDITERRHMEQQRRRLATELQTLLEHAGVGIAYLKDRRVVRCNRHYAAMFGYAPEELVGHSVRKLHLSDESYEERARTAYPQVLAGGTFTEEVQVRRKDGSVFWVSTTLTPIDPQDISQGVIQVANDITERRAQEEALRASEERFRQLTELSSDWYWEQDENYRFISTSDGMSMGTGRTPPEILGRTRWELDYVDLAEEKWGEHQALLEAHRPFRDFETARRGADGELVHISLSGDPIFDTSGRFRGYRGVGRNITERKRTEDALRLSGRAIESSRNGIMITDARAADGPIIYVNRAFEDITGYSADKVLGHNPRLLVGPDTEQIGLEEIRAALREGRPGEAVLQSHRTDGTPFWNELSVAPVRDDNGDITHWVGIINDVTDRKRYEEALERQANYDSLTGLANRNLLFDRVRQAIVHSTRSGRAMAVLLLDLDRFKLINDSYGHVFGDALLRVVGERLTGCVRRDDTVARLGGDEFVIMLADMAREDDASRVAKKVLDAVAQPIVMDGRELLLTTSLGVSLHPRDGDTPDVLLKNADSAMYRAKEQGRNAFQFYTQEMNARAAQYLTIQHDLARALAREEFELHYQPIIDCVRGAVRGAEALIRWRKPDGSMISPADFIPLAEDSGLIVPIGEWALRTACAQTKAWHDAGHGSIGISVNLSPRQFRQKDLGAMISSALAETGLPADRLALEITEGTVMDNPEAAAATLRELAAMGIGISIDDFGTGYSSLGYLNRFPVRDLKIDRSFVRELDAGGDGAAIVTAVIGLAHSLGVKVVAEGVETAEQLAFLIAQGCDAAQGFYLSRPIPIAPFGALLAERRMFLPAPVAQPATSARRSEGAEPRDRKSTGSPRKSTGPARKTRGATPKSVRRPPRKSSARRKRSR